MIHQYIAALDKTCRVCKRPAFDHSILAICESCTNFANTDNDIRIVDGILLCADCFAKNQEPKVPGPINALTATNVSELAPDAKLASLPSVSYGEGIDVAVKINPYTLVDLPLNGNEYFNAQTISFIELEKYVYADNDVPADKKLFKLTEQMQFRRAALKNACFEATQLVLETKSGMAAIDVGLNRLAGRLREEERALLKIEHIDYKPSAPKAPKVVRVSKEDKTIQQYADKMGITFEHAKGLLAQYIKEAHEMMGNKCSCAETPGICKIHFPTKG